MPHFELKFTDEEIRLKLKALETELPPTTSTMPSLGTLTEGEQLLLAKIKICEDRTRRLCDQCGIMCDTSCVLGLFEKIVIDLRRALETTIRYRVNCWIDGLLGFHQGFVAQVDECQIEIGYMRKFASFAKPPAPDQRSVEWQVQNALFQGDDALKYLPQSLRK